MMLLDSSRLDSQLFVWAVSISSILMTWNLSPIPPFRFARARDVGITGYLVLVSFWFWLSLDPTILAPLFFADPAGAVVGKWASRVLGSQVNYPWYGKKTIVGSAAVFVMTFVTITFTSSVYERLVISSAATFVEAIGGDYDNLGIAAVVLYAWSRKNS
jgi:hypothetical protein